MDNVVQHVNYDVGKLSICWPVEIDGKYTNTIRNYLSEEGIPREGIQSIIKNSACILGYCPNPRSSQKCNRNGIVIGKVQSGKTSNFLTVTAMAFDNGYNIVIILGGTKKPLVKQNSTRVREYFSKVDNEVLVLDTNSYRDQLNEQTIEQFLDMSRKIIIVALKSPAQINFLSGIFLNTSLSDEPVLIIDDEGDEASLNVGTNGSISPTYCAITKLKNTINRHCYISVTATPQAPMLIDAIDLLSPDFGVLTDPGEGYCGLDVFHGADSKYTISIPHEEKSLLDEGIPASFSLAFSMFFVACGIFKFRGMCPGDKLSMLIHPSQMKIDHSRVKTKVQSLRDEWKSAAGNKNDVSFSSLRAKLIQAYSVYECNGSEIPAFEKIEDYILDAIKFCGLHIVNGDVVPNEADKMYDYNIYVGGNMLGRGLTLKGLAITYIIRTSESAANVDTVQQRARWFGYKRRYLDICRIFAVNKIIREYRLIRDHEEDLWDTVRSANLQGTKFKEIPRIFLLSEEMHMTRSNVARTRNFTFSNWNIQHEFLNVQEYIDSNNCIINKFKQEHNNFIEEKQFGGGAPFIILRNLHFESVCANFLEKFIFPEESKLSVPMIQKLMELLRGKNIEAKTDIIWMRLGDNETSKHPVSDGYINNYMVGPRPKNQVTPIYRGDRYEFIRENCMQLQIHKIEDTNTGIVSPMLALYLPNEYIEKLTNLVIRD